jgi:hypothetical protein
MILLKIYALCTLFVSINAFAMGNLKPKWFNGTEEQKASVSGWVNHLNTCGKTQFKKEDYKMFYNTLASTKTFKGKNLTLAYEENYMEASVTNSEANSYSFQVINDFNNVKNESAHQAEGRAVSLMMAWALGIPFNHYDKCIDETRWLIMRDDRSGILYDTTDIPENEPEPDPEGCSTNGSRTNLIKPISDTSGTLVLVLSCEYLRQFSSVTVKGEKGRDKTNYEELPNGRRYHWTFSKAGSHYGVAEIVATKKDGSKLCYSDNMGVRKEGWKFKNCGSSNPEDEIFENVSKWGGPEIGITKDVADWPVTRNFKINSIEGMKLMSSIDGKAYEPAVDGLSGNFAMAAQQSDGSWIVGTWDYCRASYQTVKTLSNLEAGGTMAKSFNLHKGQKVCFFYTGLSRSSARNARERSNLDCTIWMQGSDSKLAQWKTNTNGKASLTIPWDTKYYKRIKWYYNTRMENGEWKFDQEKCQMSGNTCFLSNTGSSYRKGRHDGVCAESPIGLPPELPPLNKEGSHCWHIYKHDLDHLVEVNKLQ